MSQCDAANSAALAGPPAKPAAYFAAPALGLVAFVSFGLHELASVDLGYHLAYGQWMAQHARVISENQFAYTCPGWEFVNANWLFQLILYATYDLAGPIGLSVFLLLLITTLGLSLALFMHLRGIHPVLNGLFLAAIALTSYERFLLRPELISFLCLVWTLILLHLRDRHARASLLGLAAVQLLWTNCHSYFLLGPALVAAYWITRLAEVMVRRLTRRSTTHLLAELRWLALATAVTVACCLLNPRFVTGALMPLRTLGYLYRTDALAAQPGDDQAGPWAAITEFGWPLLQAKIPLAMQFFYRLSLGLGAAAALAQILRRRLLDLPALALLLPASLAMRRNIPLWALAAWPAVAETCQWSLQRLRRRFASMSARPFKPIALVIACVALAALGYDVLTDHFYIRERRELRAGLGVSSLAYPAGGVQFLARNQLGRRLYCQFEVGSYLLFFAEPPRPVFVHSDTFAYPPEFFDQAVRSQTDPDLFAALASRYDVDAVLLKHTYAHAHALIHALAGSAEWAPVFFDHNCIVFLRQSREHQKLIQDLRLDPTAVSLTALAAAAANQDPHAPGLPLVFLGNLFASLGWEDVALRSYDQAARLQPGLYEAWNQMGVLWGARAQRAASAGDAWRQRQYNLKALGCFQRALEQNPRYRHAKQNLALARKNLGL